MTLTRSDVTLRNKVPEVTVFFWIIKILATTVGETAADDLATQLDLGLTTLTYIVSAVFIVALAFQLRARTYVPGIYWLNVVLISVVGTLITDNLTDNAGVALQTTTVIFAIVLAAVFGAWYAVERTLSIHSIVTLRREAFYWLTILFTFALGTAAGDLTAEKFFQGGTDENPTFNYWGSALLFAAVIAVVYAAHRIGLLGAVLAFWLAYIVTRPLGASLGDYLSQPSDIGGLALGTEGTSALFLAAILGLVVYLARSKVDQTPPEVLRGEVSEL
jgi:uncharacterized membrane-anchored protein